LEQQAAHSSFRAYRRRGDRREDKAKALNERLGHSDGERNPNGCMNEQEASLHITADPCALVQSLVRYRESSCARSIFEIVITVLPFVLLWLMMWASLAIGYWLCLLLSLPAAGFSCAYS
jgi:hypothetical protein